VLCELVACCVGCWLGVWFVDLLWVLVACRMVLLPVVWFAGLVCVFLAVCVVCMQGLGFDHLLGGFGARGEFWWIVL